MNNTFPRRSLSRLAGVCAALLLLTACGALLLLTACGAPAAGGGPVHRGRLNLERVRALCYNKASARRLTMRMQGFSLQYFACAALGFPLRGSCRASD